MSEIDRSKLIEKLIRYSSSSNSEAHTHVAVERELLSQAIEVLVDEAPPPTDASGTPLVDGRFDGGNSEIFVSLRIDSSVSGVISADIYRVGSTGRTYDCSIRTNPGHAVQATERSWGIVGTDESDNSALGRLTLQVPESDSTAIIGTLIIETAFGTLPVQRDIIFTGSFASEVLREVGIEIETEAGVESLPSFTMGGEDITVKSAFQKAGLELVNTGIASTIPKPSGGEWGTGQLHALMTDFAEAPLSRRSWQLQLLLLDQSSLNGLLGIMFDTTEVLPRQGCAVFRGEVEQFTSGTHSDRKLIQTTLHELGHALNLAHRFEREVGHRDSFSIMNYDWRFRGGNQEDEYWAGFDFSFDPDELEFLRHAPLPLVVPGGAAFHSVDYWSDGNGNYSPYVPEQDISAEVSLTLLPPSSGPVFMFGQPVFLEVVLTNTTDVALELQPSWLDAKSGFIEFQILRRGEDTFSHFHPIMERCFDLTKQTADVVSPGNSIRNNVNLTFGSAGFPFIEPGTYDIIAVLALPIVEGGEFTSELVVKSAPLQIRIAHPMSLEEEADALVLFREDVGNFFALGGSPVLDKANSALQELCDRRQGSNKRITDPVVASIVRCQGIDAGRPYTRYKDGKFIQEEGRREDAAQLLEKLTPAILKYFDEHTAAATRNLCQKHRAAYTKS